MKTNSRFSRNVYAISDRIWCNKHLRHTTPEKYNNNGKGGYIRFDDETKTNGRHYYILFYGPHDNYHSWIIIPWKLGSTDFLMNTCVTRTVLQWGTLGAPVTFATILMHFWYDLMAMNMIPELSNVCDITDIAGSVSSLNVVIYTQKEKPRTLPHGVGVITHLGI